MGRRSALCHCSYGRSTPWWRMSREFRELWNHFWLPRCSPNLSGVPARAPLSIAVASNDLESVEELLAYQADPNVASDGVEPPLCVAVRHQRQNIVCALLEHRADINIRSSPTAHPEVVWRAELGLTPLELAAGNEAHDGSAQ